MIKRFIVNFLLRKGTDPNAKKNQYRKTPLHTAIEYNNLKVADALLANRSEGQCKRCL
ncbi:MAG: ankyrin repeat domain-containing protein [Bdellovibrionales bacterium]|nr:ankyrin repeat domain-containing protein [Bdellovibrionales bacterium]